MRRRPRNVVVLGDSMADWLAYGLEDAFADTPEIGIVRKHRTDSGPDPLRAARRDVDWAQVAREIIAAEKPKFIVMMVGFNDRQPIRERRAGGRAPARGRSRAAGRAGTTPAPAAAVRRRSRAKPSADAAERRAEAPAQPEPPIAAPRAEPEGAAPARGARIPLGEMGPSSISSASTQRSPR